MDLYMIMEKYNYDLKDLIRKAKIKFDWHVDSLKLGSQFLQVTELKDYPKLIEALNEKDWQAYFMRQAKNLGQEIIEK